MGTTYKFKIFAYSKATNKKYKKDKQFEVEAYVPTSSLDDIALYVKDTALPPEPAATFKLKLLPYQCGGITIGTCIQKELIKLSYYFSFKEIFSGLYHAGVLSRRSMIIATDNEYGYWTHLYNKGLLKSCQVSDWIYNKNSGKRIRSYTMGINWGGYGADD